MVGKLGQQTPKNQARKPNYWFLGRSKSSFPAIARGPESWHLCSAWPTASGRLVRVGILLNNGLNVMLLNFYPRAYWPDTHFGPASWAGHLRRGKPIKQLLAFSLVRSASGAIGFQGIIVGCASLNAPARCQFFAPF
jgi:hypothetical protein